LTYYVQGKYPRALINYFESVKINEEIGNKKGMANAYNMIGIIYQYQGGYSQSLKYCYESLKIRESFADKHNMALCRTNIGIAYSKAKNYEDALQNYELALNIYKEENDKKNIAGTYVNTGNNYKYQKKYEKALENYTLAKPIFQEIKDKRSLISTVTSIGEVQRQLGNFEAASFALDEAMILAPDVNNNMSYATLYGDLADLYIKKSEKATSKADRELFNTKGEEYLKNCMKYYKITNSLSDKLLFYESSIELDSIKGDFKQAFEDTKLLMDCKLEMKDEDYVKKADLLKVQYELELKEQEAKIEEEKKQKK
ncbi:tetratricopeptide repeat protein, partial [bacterium]|nr:tetratricopeptide repeat protein [bacterium]